MDDAIPRRLRRRAPQNKENTLTLRLLDSAEEESERILSAIAGEPTALTWIVNHYTPPIYRYCLRMLRQEETAQEVTQEVMLRALSKIQHYDPQRSFKTWLFSIARNACIDHHRKKRPMASAETDLFAASGELADETIDRKLRAKRLHRAVGELPELYREVIVLYHFEHFKYQEIAETLDLPLGTVMNRIFRARKKLRAALECPP